MTNYLVRRHELPLLDTYSLIHAKVYLLAYSLGLPSPTSDAHVASRPLPKNPKRSQLPKMPHSANRLRIKADAPLRSCPLGPAAEFGKANRHAPPAKR